MLRSLAFTRKIMDGLNEEKNESKEEKITKSKEKIVHCVDIPTKTFGLIKGRFVRSIRLMRNTDSRYSQNTIAFVSRFSCEYAFFSTV